MARFKLQREAIASVAGEVDREELGLLLAQLDEIVEGVREGTPRKER